MSGDKIKVLYIAGLERSGSTLLGAILGQVEGFFNAGELANIWTNLTRGFLCGCGALLRECALWRDILDEAFGGSVDYVAMRRYRAEVIRMHHFLSLSLSSRGFPTVPRLRWYRENVGRLYAAIRSRTGCRVIVDSSKTAPYLHVLMGIPALDLYVAHLVRDARGVVFSWRRRKRAVDRTGEHYFHRRGVMYASCQWAFRNAVLEALARRLPGRCLRLRYEDVVAEPRQAVGRILDLVGESGAGLSFLRQGEIERNVDHTAGGNPIRLQRGLVALRPDVEWQSAMRRLDRATVMLSAWPMLWRYGYLGRDGRSAREPASEMAGG